MSHYRSLLTVRSFFLGPHALAAGAISTACPDDVARVRVADAALGSQYSTTLQAVTRTVCHETPRRCHRVAREVNLELGRAITAILEAERLELVFTDGKGLWCCLNQTVVVAWSELSTVDTDETACAVVSMQAERVDTWHVYAERDAQVETYVCRSPVQTDIVVRKLRGIGKRAMAVTHRLHLCIGTFSKCAHRLHVGTQPVSRLAFDTSYWQLVV